MKRIRKENINTKERYSKIFNNKDIAKIDFNKTYAEIIYDFLLKEGSIIDVGCWKGEYLNYWINKNPKLKSLGIDFSDEALNYIKKNFPKIEVKNIDIDNKLLPFKDNSFDMAVCLEVLEHIENPKLLISELIRIIKKRIIISVPYELEVKSPFHIWEFNILDFKDLLNLSIKIEHIGPRMIIIGNK
jgi:ubiquinone/menaquinone biosynthesis C-methylase UbiE